MNSNGNEMDLVVKFEGAIILHKEKVSLDDVQKFRVMWQEAIGDLGWCERQLQETPTEAPRMGM